MGIFLKLFDKDADRLLHEGREMYRPLAAHEFSDAYLRQSVPYILPCLLLLYSHE